MDSAYEDDFVDTDDIDFSPVVEKNEINDGTTYISNNSAHSRFADSTFTSNSVPASTNKSALKIEETIKEQEVADVDKFNSFSYTENVVEPSDSNYFTDRRTDKIEMKLIEHESKSRAQSKVEFVDVIKKESSHQPNRILNALSEKITDISNTLRSEFHSFIVDCKLEKERNIVESSLDEETCIKYMRLCVKKFNYYRSFSIRKMKYAPAPTTEDGKEATEELKEDIKLAKELISDDVRILKEKLSRLLDNVRHEKHYRKEAEECNASQAEKISKLTEDIEKLMLSLKQVTEKCLLWFIRRMPMCDSRALVLEYGRVC